MSRTKIATRARVGTTAARPGQPGVLAQWFHAIDGKHGAYVIRHDAGTVVYVGESHSGQLQRTLVRHFQRWHSATNHAYDRQTHVVDVWVTTTPAEAVALQDRLIRRLKPRDNGPAGQLALPWYRRLTMLDDTTPF